MKRLLALALCAAFALNAEARTLYVDASRPNNSGNGLSVKKAKKTLQAAVNVSKNGDTIIVLKGTYAAPLKTNNKRLRIKSRAGADATTISAKKWLDNYSLNLGSGTSTAMTGFTVTPKFTKYDWDEDGGGSYSVAGGVKGGSLSNCRLVELGETYNVKWTVSKSKLVACVLDQCKADTYGNFVTGSTLTRCKVDGSGWKTAKVQSSKFANSLIANTQYVAFQSCVFGNCTVADNTKLSMKSTKAYNTIFYKVGSAQFKSKKKNTLKNCYKGNPKFVALAKEPTYEWVETDPDTGDGYYDSDGTPADYHLQVGSPCIDKGTKTSAAKKLYGKKDLDGKKRVRGKSVDIGCYEF